MSLSDVIDKVLREFLVHPEDVVYFCHDSASYMAPAAERLRKDKGYKNLVDVPCWAHLLNLLGHIIFDLKLLPEMHEYMRLTKVLFAR